jgi:hypothetical protein
MQRIRPLATSAVASAVISLACTASHAAVITFDGLTGATADPLAPYTEDGFTVSPSSGAWKEAHVFGAPLPSVYVQDLSDAPFGALAITFAGGLFTFNALDLHANFSALGFELRGYRGGVQQFSLADGFPVSPSSVFTTIASPSSVLIDTLTLDISSGGFGAFNVDNIDVAAPVPEPSTWALLLAGVTGLVWTRRQPR